MYINNRPKQRKGDDVLYKVKNPYSPEERYLYFISDPPHLIKTVRNAWASPHRHLWVSAYSSYSSIASIECLHAV